MIDQDLPLILDPRSFTACFQDTSNKCCQDRDRLLIEGPVFSVADSGRGMSQEAAVQVPRISKLLRRRPLPRLPQVHRSSLQMPSIKVACQDDSLQLSCNPHSRVVVYSASFGRTEYESVRCPQPQGVREESEYKPYAYFLPLFLSSVVTTTPGFGRTEYESVRCPQPQGVMEDSEYKPYAYFLPLFLSSVVTTTPGWSYSASFGRTEYESVRCPQPQGVMEDSEYKPYVYSRPLFFSSVVTRTPGWSSTQPALAAQSMRASAARNLRVSGRKLSCNPHSRVVVYSASFGRTEYESVRCPQPQGVMEDSEYKPYVYFRPLCFSSVVTRTPGFGRTEYESVRCPQPQGVMEDSEYKPYVYSRPLFFSSVVTRTPGWSSTQPALAAQSMRASAARNLRVSGRKLSCNPHSRVVVYSASFGRTEYESVRCPQPQGVREETCLATYATETVMQICHGMRQCSLTADAATFGNPCNHLSKTYLKVVYTCVPKTVLREQLDDQVEEDERSEPDYEVDYESVDNALRENHVYSESPKLAVSGGRHNGSGVGGQIAPPATATADQTRGDQQFQETRNRVILGLVFAIACGLVLLVALVAARLWWGRRRGGRTVDKALTKGYSEDGDVEIDLTSSAAITVLPTPHHHTPPQE
ncbi:hypothetical protein J6590_103445, partial [Homalodisca vitripennis]